MNYHTAASTEFAYTPDYMICNTSYYSDVENRHTNGLIMTRVCSSDSPTLWKFKISSSDLSTFFLSDLIKLLNRRKDSAYMYMLKQHKSSTATLNLIDYDELKATLDLVDSLQNMSNRLKIVGTSSSSIQNNSKNLSIGSCIRGRVSNPDNFFAPLSNFFDTKVNDLTVISDFLVLGIKNSNLSYYDRPLCKYALGGSIIYLLIYKRNDIYDYIVFLSEEPISLLNQCLLEKATCGVEFEYIYTVIGRTNTKDDSIPYTVTSNGVYFRDIILNCNANCFTMPIVAQNRVVSRLVVERN